MNAKYAKYYRHAIETDFSGDESNWSIVQSLVLARYGSVTLLLTVHHKPVHLLVYQCSVAITCASTVAYLYGSSCNNLFLEDYVKYTALTLVFTAATSIAAVVMSLNTYALGHQFYTGGGEFVKVPRLPYPYRSMMVSAVRSIPSTSSVQGWFVYSAFVYGCEGPQYLPGPGIVMAVIGAVSEDAGPSWSVTVQG